MKVILQTAVIGVMDFKNLRLRASSRNHQLGITITQVLFIQKIIYFLPGGLETTTIRMIS